MMETEIVSLSKKTKQKQKQGIYPSEEHDKKISVILLR